MKKNTEPSEYYVSMSVTSAAHLPENVWFRAQHELDVLADVLEAIDPHETDKFPNADECDGEACAVSVHQVEDVLAAVGGAGQPQQETREAGEKRDLDLVELKKKHTIEKKL